MTAGMWPSATAAASGGNDYSTHPEQHPLDPAGLSAGPHRPDNDAQAPANRPAQNDHYEPPEEAGIIGRSPVQIGGYASWRCRAFPHSVAGSRTIAALMTGAGSVAVSPGFSHPAGRATPVI